MYQKPISAREFDLHEAEYGLVTLVLERGQLAFCSCFIISVIAAFGLGSVYFMSQSNSNQALAAGNSLGFVFYGIIGGVLIVVGAVSLVVLWAYGSLSDKNRRLETKLLDLIEKSSAEQSDLAARFADEVMPLSQQIGSLAAEVLGQDGDAVLTELRANLVSELEELMLSVGREVRKTQVQKLRAELALSSGVGQQAFPPGIQVKHFRSGTNYELNQWLKRNRDEVEVFDIRQSYFRSYQVNETNNIIVLYRTLVT